MGELARTATSRRPVESTSATTASGSGKPVLPGLTMNNVNVTFAGGTYNKTTGAGVPTTVTISFNNYKHQPLFDLGKLTKVKSLSLNVAVKPSITMLYLLNANSI